MTHFLPVLHLMTEALRRRLLLPEAPVPDPIDHPALRRMSSRELADLPLPRPLAEEAAEGERRRVRPAA